MMLLLSVGYGSTPYVINLPSDAYQATLLRDVPAAGLPAGAVLGVYWQPGSEAPVDEGAAVAIAYGAPTPGDTCTMRIAGAVDARHAFEWPVPPGVNVTRDVPLTVAIPPGAAVYVVHGVRYAGMGPRVLMAQTQDRLRAGVVLTAPAGGGSLLDLIGQTVDFTPSADLHPVQVAVTS